MIEGPREQLSQFAPRIQTIQIDPSQIGLLIGKGGETIRGLAEEFESQIDVNDDGQVLIYSANGELGDALVERVRMMMKEVEVGDEYVGKVVKTTTFGAFVELAKGTDGLLHISNVSPGQRVESVEDVLNKGDEVNVRVVEVDRERGRIGLRLADDPDIAGKSVEELAGVGTGGGGGGGRPPRDGAAAQRARALRAWPARRRVATASAARGARATAATATEGPLQPEHQITTLDSRRASGHRARAERALGGARLLDRARARSPSATSEAGISHLLEHMLFRGTERFGSEEIDQIFDAMGAEINAGTDKEATSLYTRVLDRHLERAFDVMGDMVWQPRFGELETEREVVLEEIAMYEDDPAGPGLRRARRGRLRRAPARARGDRHRAGRRRGHARAARRLPRRALRAAEHRDRRRRLGRARRARRAGRALDRAARRRTPAPAPQGGARGGALDADARRTSRGACASSRKTPSSTTCASAAPGIARDDERRFALRVLEGVLGGTSSSRLFQEVRERRGLAYSVFSFSNLYAHTGEVGLYVGTRPDNLAAGAGGDRRRARALRRGPGQPRRS